ncbi:hypothetical protein [Pseudonocardia humida]|uniref:Uncharacterized protein n=1 Tax=Pseudonocardia humida TaxID=2800819 RepID=A0ABT1AAN4_9PSEU|nr:hypothetical protein [Pseudonocardia humida]MCO1660102.1 hypothetical protein [Pseudonocardia humida]
MTSGGADAAGFREMNRAMVQRLRGAPPTPTRAAASRRDPAATSRRSG